MAKKKRFTNPIKKSNLLIATSMLLLLGMSLKEICEMFKITGIIKIAMYAIFKNLKYLKL